MWQAEVSKLIRSVFFNGHSQHIRSVVFTEIGNGNGRAWIGAHAADVLATAVSGRVCVVDANLRQPSLHTCFRVSNRMGFADLVMEASLGVMDVAQNVGSNLWLLPSGQMSPPEQVFQSPYLAVRIAELRKLFDHLIVAAPDLNHLADVIAIGQRCDGLVFIVRANSIRRETALRAKQEVEAARVMILGSVLTDRTFPIPQAIYSRL
jgi:protein-tyrosine kinase